MRPMDKHIYFMRPVFSVGLIKIGCTGFPEKRLRQISMWSPFPLEIVCMVPGNHEIERALHRCFADVHSHCEWFHPVPRLLEAIDKIKAGVAIEEAVDFTDIRGSITHRKGPAIKPITAETIRANLITRAKAFSKANNISFWAIGNEAVGDNKFLGRVEAGENFNVKTYQRVIDWLDAQEAAVTQAAE